MKFLLLLVVALLVLWAWRSNRPVAPPRKSKPDTQPQDMVSCAQCGLHFPKADAVAGDKGLYCCAEHRQRAEP